MRPLAPAYRQALIALAVLGGIIGAGAYAENRVLEHIVGAMGGGRSPWMPLALLAGLGLLRTGAGATHTALSGRLEIRSRNDLEREILAHLLRRDDAFFRDHPTGEILNRMSGDVARAARLRVVWTQNLRAALLLLGNVWFFVQSDWRLAIAATTTTAAGLWITARWTRSVQAMDRAYLSSDDLVKSRFEDLLAATPEVQVGNLFDRVIATFASAIAARARVYGLYVRLQSWMAVSHGLSYLIALLSLFVVALVFLSGGRVGGAAALVPVFLKALPELFTNASTIVYSRVDLQRTQTSCERLLEYECAVSDDRGRGGTPGGLSMDAATLQYAGPGGKASGGVVDLSARFEPGSWVVLAGRAGAGKSTMVQLLSGRVRPQRGTVRVGGQALHDVAPAGRAELLTLLPQKIVLLDSTIRENLLFGRADRADLTADDLELVEAAGIGEICRRKALDLYSGTGGELTGPVVALRSRLRARLADELSLRVDPYETDGVDDQHWMIEALLDGRGERAAVQGALGGAEAFDALRELFATDSGRLLASLGASLVAETRELLRLPTLHAYNAVAPLPLDERSWRFRQAALAEVESGTGAKDGIAAMRATLCAPLGELRVLPAFEEATVRAMLAGLSRDARPVAAVLGTLMRPYDRGSLHPHLTWRENLLFAAIETPNRRAHDRVDSVLLEAVRAEGLGDAFTRIGLDVPVGRGGERLSGGQRQLVALGRALLRRTPVLILDEPTSALDPQSRDRVIALLRAWSAGRTIVTVSHDPEILAAADEILLLENGRLAAQGRYRDLLGASPELRAIFHQRGVEAG